MLSKNSIYYSNYTYYSIKNKLNRVKTFPRTIEYILHSSKLNIYRNCNTILCKLLLIF